MKNLHNPDYWDKFSRGLLEQKEWPNPKEAGEFVLSLFLKIKKAEEETKLANQEAKLAHQEFKTFAMEVSNLANKRSTNGRNS
jgi:hypothetical protein